jgi:hypothetical protein
MKPIEFLKTTFHLSIGAIAVYFLFLYLGYETKTAGTVCFGITFFVGILKAVLDRQGD